MNIKRYHVVAARALRALRISRGLPVSAKVERLANLDLSKIDDPSFRASAVKRR